METILKWEHLKNTLEEFGKILRNMYQDKLINDDKIASGQLLNTAEYVVEYGDYQISMGLRLQDYYKYVENGRKPGKFPPMDAIIEYIRVKPIIPDERTGRLPDERQLAFLIARKIANEGIEPGNQLKDSVQELYDEWMRKIDEAITQDLAEGMDAILTFYL